MCGIVALISTGKQPLDEAVPGVEKALDNALDRIQHRGPDGRGIWVSDDRKVALAHCRLSINDLSPSGSQPLHSPSGIHTVVNGELYDYAPLRSSLEARGYTFTSGSDSELVLYLYEEYGLDFVQYLRGEFAIVLLDARKGKERSVVVRDRYGIKPMFVRYVQDGAQSKDENKDLAQGGYVTGEKQGGAVLMFAAEMKAFLELGWKPEWDVGAIATGAWGQDTRTVFKGVHKLRPAHMMVIEDGKIDTKVYWDASYPDKFVSQETAWLRPVADAQTYKDPRSEEEMVLQTRSLLIDSVAQRLRADVPIGIYLSGGIDSSALAGIADHLVREKGLSMGTPIAPTSSQNPSSSHSEAEAAAEAHKSRICCFSIAFDLGSGHDESSVARRTADHLGVRFITQHMDEQALADAFEEAVYSCEHHNHDLNFVGKHALSRLPREYGYKVVLTGEGADEHFGGYPLYFPDHLSEVDASNGLGDDERVELRDRLVKERADGYDFGGANGEYMRTHPSARPSGHLPLYTPGAMLAFTPLSTILSPAALSAFSPSADDSLRMIANNISPAAQGDIKDKWHPLNSAMYVWGKGHLANQFLSCLGDRVEMAHSVEARTPFLDHRLAEHVNGLPVGMKVRVTRTKDDGDGEGEGEGPEEKLEKDVQASLDQAPGAGAHANGIAQPDGANKATPNGVTATSKSDPIFTEKYALREAVKPFVTPEVYTRTKYPYSAPSVYPANGPVNTLLNKLVTKERIEQLGWVNWDVVGKMKEQAWTCEEHPKGSKEQGEAVRAWRQVLMLAEWTVLAERFGVETWMSDQWSDH